jgi:hypothetical protein
MYHVVGKVY